MPSVSAERTLTSLYEAIHRRRDVRGQFTGAPIDPEALERVLAAAHAAPSVGLTQPWDFVLVSDVATKQAFVDHINDERAEFAASLPPDRASIFAGIKIDGVMESTLSVVVTYDAARGAPGVLGRHAIADAGLYSVCLAIQNLWLAATAEGLGVGWVSFYREPFVRAPGDPRGRPAGGLALPRARQPPRGDPRPGAARLAPAPPPLRGASPRAMDGEDRRRSLTTRP